MPDTPPPILYKYMSSARIGFFDTPQLRFTPPAEFNDIFDCQPRTKGLFSSEFLKEQLTSQADSKFDQLLDEELLKKGVSRSALRMLTPSKRAELKKQFAPLLQMFIAQVAPMSATVEHRGRLTQAVQNALLRSRVGVLCLTPDNASPKMWGIYATGPKGQGSMGFAVGFDTSNAFFNRKLTPEDALRHLRPVSYPENLPERFFSDYLQESVPEQSFLFEAIYIKDKEWEAEKEWRMAVTVSDSAASEVFGIENVPINAIKEVLLGAHVTSDLEDAAKVFCIQHEISLYRMKTTVDRMLKPELIVLTN